jgi:CRISPR/Cas system-associated exonuclease Cas4 (RecB family)
MNDNLAIGLGVMTVIILFSSLVLVIYRGNKNRFNLKEAGHILWKDSDHETAFYNHQFKIYGKPDLLIESEKGICAVEYKSSPRRIYDTDLIQVYSAALAVRGEGIDVRWVCIKTAACEQVLALPQDDHALYEKIQVHVDQARRALAGQSCPPTQFKAKCYRCSMGNHCIHRPADMRKIA